MKKQSMKCPVCKKPALAIRKYKDGSSMAIHETQKGLFGFTEVTKACIIKKEA